MRRIRTHNSRPKTFGFGNGRPMSLPEKAAIMVEAEAYNAAHKSKGQHKGPLTRTTLEVLRVLLFGFHNTRDGRCFPSYERIAEKAKCTRSSVAAAIKALEAAGLMTWVHRIRRIQHNVRDVVTGAVSWVDRVIRTSNAYLFARLKTPENRAKTSKSENPTVTPPQDPIASSLLSNLAKPSRLEAALASLGRAMEGQTALPS